MKRQLLIALLLGLSATICYSQVKINAQAGTGLTGITKNENYNANFGYRFGLGVEFPIDRTWSLQTGLHFLRKNYSVDDSSLIQNSAEGGGTYLFHEKNKIQDKRHLRSTTYKDCSIFTSKHKLRIAVQHWYIHSLWHRR